MQVRTLTGATERDEPTENIIFVSDAPGYAKQVKGTPLENIQNDDIMQVQRASEMAKQYSEVSIDADEILPTVPEGTVQMTVTPCG